MLRRSLAAESPSGAKRLLTLREIGERLFARGGGPSRLVASLVEAGLLRRAERPNDRRAVEVSLTVQGVAAAKGVAAANEVWRAEKALHEWLATALGARDVAATAIYHAVDEDEISISSRSPNASQPLTGWASNAGGKGAG